MSSAMISQTLQGAVLSTTSNVLAQAITSYKENTPFALNIAQMIKFAIFSIVSNPPNIVWQSFIEGLFPTNVPVPQDADAKPTTPAKTQLSIANVLKKFLLDTTLGAFMNTFMFLAYMGYVNAIQGEANGLGPWENITNECKEKMWPMIVDGWKFWPAISLVSFLWVPVDKRIVFGCTAGMVWGVYLSMMVN